MGIFAIRKGSWWCWCCAVRAMLTIRHPFQWNLGTVTSSVMFLWRSGLSGSAACDHSWLAAVSAALLHVITADWQRSQRLYWWQSWFPVIVTHACDVAAYDTRTFSAASSAKWVTMGSIKVKLAVTYSLRRRDQSPRTPPLRPATAELTTAIKLKWVTLQIKARLTTSQSINYSTWL